MTSLLPIPPDENALDVSTLRANPPEGEARQEIARQLVRRALNQRDVEAARLTAEWMIADPTLDAAVYEMLDRALVVEPDAVYAFARAVVSDSGEPDPAWRERLKVAALSSLQVAITDGDSETVLNWLRLIAREPAAYELGEVLAAGFAAAQARAHDDADLARSLVLLAAKRTPVLLDTLLSDDALRTQLPDSLCEALQYGAGDPIALLNDFGSEIFLATLSRSTGLRAPDLFNADSIEKVWTLANGENGSAAAAEKLIKAWSSGEPLDWMPEDAVSALLRLTLVNRRDDLFYALISRTTRREDFVPLLSTAIAGSGRSAADALALVAQVMAAGHIDQQGAAAIYVALLEAWSWDPAVFDLVEQLARALQQHPDVQVGPEALWQMLGVAGERKEDFTARAVLRRLLASFDKVEDETVLAEEITRVFSVVNWNGAARTGLLNWWREYAHNAPVARLQRLERAMPEKTADGRRPEDIRAILGTVLAYRRMVGKRSLGQFAEDVATTFGVLTAFAESFDPNSKRTLVFDPATFRFELESHLAELADPEKKILANNLKELAGLIASMAEHRSKASLVRRAEDVDRLLMQGGNDPHSAVDALKWIAGFLSGSQQNEADEE
ncbi:MAG: hypothetical protein IPK19_22555 [Chloroflexi bacterium]|nr:hypothetical protein [Chloroflexota bacterium]